MNSKSKRAERHLVNLFKALTRETTNPAWDVV